MTVPRLSIRPPGVPKPKRKHEQQWELAYAAFGGHEVLLHLTAGWEPFAVTQFSNETPALIWFRRQVRA